MEIQPGSFIIGVLVQPRSLKLETSTGGTALTVHMQSSTERVSSSGTATRTQQTPQHYRLTLETAKRHYQDGHLTATGLVYFAIAIQRKPGWKLRMDAKTAEKELGLRKTAFYSAISRLKADGWIEWEARSGINVWIPVEAALNQLPPLPQEPPQEPPYPQQGDASTFAESPHSQQDGFSANAESSPRMRKVVRIRGKLSAFAETESPKSAQDKADSTSSDSLQSSINLVAAEEEAAAPKNSFAEEEEKEVAKADEVVPQIVEEATWNEVAPTSTEIRGIETREAAIEGIDPDAESDSLEAPVNSDSREICTALRDAGLLNPQLRDLAIKFTLAEVQAALNLYQQRKQVKPIPNPPGWLTGCLNGRWWKEQCQTTTASAQYPPELVAWYEKACKAGIVVERELKDCPSSSNRSTSPEYLCVVVEIPPQERPPNSSPFMSIPWREAMVLYPLSDEDAAGGPVAYNESQYLETPDPSDFELPEGYEPDSEIQALINDSLET